MSKASIPLIEQRLSEIAREKAKCVAVCEESCSTYFRLIEQFNASRNVEEKMRLAKQAQAALGKMKTWTKRSNAAWERRLELDLEANDLSTDLFCMKVRG